jgi:hypothetical protein
MPVDSAAPAALSKRVIIIVAALTVVIGGLATLVPTAIMRSDPYLVCWSANGVPGSEVEARQALKDFFNHHTSLAGGLIKELRRDGMTDAQFDRLRSGCQDCPVRSGQGQTDYPYSWYFTAAIAPSEQSRSVVLRLDCDISVTLDAKR